MFLFLFLSLQAAELNCQIYDLATAQVLSQSYMKLYQDKESVVTLDAIGVIAQAWDRPMGGSNRQQTLIIDNGLGQSDYNVFEYNESEIGQPGKFKHVVSEIPGLGDTVTFSCK